MLDFLHEEREPGWMEWLREQQLWDERMAEDQLYLRYKKFHKLDVRVVEP